MTLTPEGRDLQDALKQYDREQNLYATAYAAEHGELPEGYRKCKDCGELVLPGEYHYHEQAPGSEPLGWHYSHVHRPWKER